MLKGIFILQKEKLWTKEFISTSLVNFVLMLAMYLLLVTMAGYAMATYGASTSLAGLVASVFIIGVLIARLYAGKQIAKMGTKKMLIIGTVIFVIMSFFYFYEAGIYYIIAIRLVQGLGVGLATTATGTIVSQIIPPRRSGEGISYFSISVVLSAAIGPLFGIALLNAFSYTSIFVFSSVVGVLSLVLAFTIREPIVEREPHGEKESFGLASIFEKNALPIGFVTFVVALGYSGILSFITTYADGLNLVTASGLFFFVYAVIILMTRPFSGKLMDAKGANSVVLPALILFAFGMFLLSKATSDFVMLLAAVLIGLGYGNFQSCTQALAIKVTPIHRMGLANSTYFISLDVALGFGPLLLGLFVPFIGFSGMYSMLVVVILAGLMLYYVLHGKRDKELFAREKAGLG
jgi:MFS family permease